jgi:hypothetical protein
MALSNCTEGGVGVVFGWCRQGQLCGKTFFTGMILQRKAAPDRSRLCGVGRRCRRRGGAGAVQMVTAYIGYRRHAAHILLFIIQFAIQSAFSGQFWLWYI